MSPSKHIRRIVEFTCAMAISFHAASAPVTPADEALDARAPGTASPGTIGAYRDGGKSARREDAKTIDLLIELQDKGGNAPVGLNHATSTVEEARAAAAKRGTAAAAAPSGPDAAVFFGVKSVPGGATASVEGSTADWKPPVATRTDGTAGAAKGERAAASESWLLSLLPRGLFLWLRENRYLVLGGALAAACAAWVASAAMSQRRS